MSSEEKSLYDTGLAVRRKVLGREYVDASIAGADDFTKPLQNLVTEYCWGAIWGRPGLSLRDRSMLNLAMLSALDRPHELKIHLRGAMTNGLSQEEVMEILLQVGVYCGIPAAMDSFRVAKEFFAEYAKEKPKG
jgi:4-carboxymuconolactone decarboxylase